MSFDFSDLFDVRRVNGSQLSGLCPFHDDCSPSFSANTDTGLWKCFAGCGYGNYEQFLSKLKSEGLPTAPAGVYEDLRAWLPSGQAMTREAYYIYLDEHGREHLRVNRFRFSDGSKTFTQEYKDSAGGWQSGGAKRKLLPYRIQDWTHSSYVVVVEGEKCVDALFGLGIYATTFCGGCNGWRDQYAQSFSGKRIILLPDNDDPGRNLMNAVEQGLAKHTILAEKALLPGLGEGGDVIDWIRAGNTPASLRIALKL